MRKLVMAVAIMQGTSVAAAAPVLVPASNISLSGTVSASLTGVGGAATTETTPDGTYAHCINLNTAQTGYATCEALSQAVPNGLFFANINQSIGWVGTDVAAATTARIVLRFTNPDCASFSGCQTITSIRSVIVGAKFGFYSGLDGRFDQIPLPDTASDITKANLGIGSEARADVRLTVTDNTDTLYSTSGAIGFNGQRRNCGTVNVNPACLAQQATDPDNSFTDQVSNLSLSLRNFRSDDGLGTNVHGYSWDDTLLSVNLLTPMLPGDTREFIYEIAVSTSNSTDCRTGEIGDEDIMVANCMSAFAYFGDPLGSRTGGGGGSDNFNASSVPGLFQTATATPPTLVLQFTPNRFFISNGTLFVADVPAPAALPIAAAGVAFVGCSRRRRR